jgi:hypothetical protein
VKHPSTVAAVVTAIVSVVITAPAPPAVALEYSAAIEACGMSDAEGHGGSGVRASFWLSEWRLGLDFLEFPTFKADAKATPIAGVGLLSFDVAKRWGEGPLMLQLGIHSFSTQNINLLAAGASYTFQLPLDWLSIECTGLAGSNFSGVGMFEFEAGWKARLWQLDCILGSRAMYLGGPGSQNLWSGLLVGAKYSFGGPVAWPTSAASDDSTTAKQPEAPSDAALSLFGQVDVDAPLAFAAKPDPDAVALIVGIEHYGHDIPEVAYARRDAQAIKRYLHDSAGVEEDNMLVLTDGAATKGALQVAFSRRLKALVSPGKSNVFVYFAGHGAPDPDSRMPFLVPSDGDPNYPAESCFSTAEMYRTLGSLGARHVTVMLDACFTGQSGRGQRPQGLIKGARPLMVRPLVPPIPKNVTVFAAAGSNQISSAYEEKQHGLFTYFLLKAMRLGNGTTRPTVAAVQKYLAEQVARQARRMGREQVPVLMNKGPATEPFGQ